MVDQNELTKEQQLEISTAAVHRARRHGIPAGTPRVVVTIEQKIREMLEQHGMWSDGLEATMKEAKEGELLKDTMRGRWGDDIEGYPAPLLSALWLNVRMLALDWVDANLPLAWYRPMLTGEKL